MEELQDFALDEDMEIDGLMDDDNGLEQVKFMRKKAIVRIIKVADIMNFGGQYIEVAEKMKRMLKEDAVLISELSDIIDTWKK